MKTPLPPTATTRNTTNTIQNIRLPWLETASVVWVPGGVPSLSEFVPPLAMVVLGGVGVALSIGVGVLPPGGVDVVVVVLMGAGDGWGLPPGRGGLVRGKL